MELFLYLSSIAIDKIGPETLFFISVAVISAIQLIAVATDE